MLTDSLVIGEEEKFALDNGPTDGAAEFVVVIWALSHLRVLKVISCVPIFVAVVLVCRSVELIRARLAHLNYDQATGFAVFR